MRGLANFIPDQPLASQMTAIGDLHGRFSNFMDSMLASGYIQNTSNGLVWIGGNSKILFHGDILGDRNQEGIKILFAIESLRTQGANIITIAGNHEEFFTGFLTSQPINGSQGNIFRLSEAVDQNQGLRELRPYFDLNQRTCSLAPEIRTVSRLTQKGENLIGVLSQFQLVHIEPDTGILFLHTPPTQEMINIIMNNVMILDQLVENIKLINKLWQEGMVEHIREKSRPNNQYKSLSQAFLYTANSYNSQDRGARNVVPMITEQQAKSLKFLGIHTIAHGHEEVPTREIGGIQIHSNDTTYGKYEEGDTRTQELPMRIYNLTQGVNARKNNVLDPQKTFDGVRSFNELYDLIQRMGSVEGSQKIYSAIEKIDIIKNVQRGLMQIGYVTSKNGLRDCVERLLGS